VPTYRDDALVLRSHLLGESDKILTLLCRKHGKVRAVAKGVRKTTSRFGARLQLFNQIDVLLNQGKSLDIVQQVESLSSLSEPIGKNYEKYTSAMVMIEAADKLTDHDFQPQHYMLLLAGLRSLAKGEHGPTLIVNSYLLRALAIAGWSPSFDACAVTGTRGNHSKFAIDLGGLVSDEIAPAGSFRLDAKTIELLQALIEGNWPKAEASVDPASLSQASRLVSAYTQFHLERNVRSLAHLDHAVDQVPS